MLLTTTIILQVSLLAVVLACRDSAHGKRTDHDHHDNVHSTKAVPTPSLPTRPLQWGDVNIIHTTDSHGWMLGHQKSSFPEPNYSGDLGDFASFVAHMKTIAIERDVDLLLVDSGDLHDGTGLTDGFPPGGIDAHDANQFIKKLPYDIMAIGNHELYIYANAYDMHTNFAPAFKGRYLSSNVNITVFNEEGQIISVPVGSRFAKFTTRKGRKVTSLGVLFDFTDNGHNTTVQKVEDMIKETWFVDAIKEEPDFFLLVGHMPIANDNWPLVFNAIRAIHPLTPILIFGGHTHIRDCLQLDGRSMSLGSGRYMETIGWLSANLNHGNNKNLTFTRRYLDANRVSYEFHTKKDNKTFDTQNGRFITEGLNDLAAKFDLSFQYGIAPHDFTLSRAPYPSDNSLATLFIQKAIPFALAINNSRASIPNIIITNSGSQRFDVFAGSFTKNDLLTATPFKDTFKFIPNVSFSVAERVLSSLNDAGANERRAFQEVLQEKENEFHARIYVDDVYRRWLKEMDSRRNQIELAAVTNLTLGYVTTDSCPGIGDDVLHTPLPFFSVPDFIGFIPPNVSSNDTPVDLVFVGFISNQLLETLNSIQTSKKYTRADVQSYSPILSNEALGLYAQAAWN